MPIQDYLPAMTGFAGAALGALGTWLGARKRYGGSIQSSEAKTLWDFTEDLQQKLYERVASLETKLDTANAERAKLEEELRRVRSELDERGREISALQAQLAAKDLQILSLTKDLAESKAKLEEMLEVESAKDAAATQVRQRRAAH